MAKAHAPETLTLSPVAQKTIELALRAGQTPETLLCAVLAQQAGDPILVVERLQGSIRATGRGAQSTPKAVDQEGINRFAQQINDFGEPADVVALGIIRPQSAIAQRSTLEPFPQYPSEGETDLLNLARDKFPQAAWQLVVDMTEEGPTVTANKRSDFFSRQSAILPNEPQAPIEFSSSVAVPQRAGRRKRK